MPLPESIEVWLDERSMNRWTAREDLRAALDWAHSLWCAQLSEDQYAAPREEVELAGLVRDGDVGAAAQLLALWDEQHV